MTTKTIPQLTEVTAFADASLLAIDTGVQTFKVQASTVRKRVLGDVVVGSASGCTHATLALALADVTVVDGMEIVLTQSYTLTAKQTISKKVKIRGLPGVTVTRSGAATIGFELDADGITIEAIRFAAFTTAGNVAISCTANSTYNRIRNCNFAVSTDTEIDDSLAPAGKKPMTVQNISEV